MRKLCSALIWNIKSFNPWSWRASYSGLEDVMIFHAIGENKKRSVRVSDSKVRVWAHASACLAARLVASLYHI